MKRWINISDAVEITNNRVKPFKGERRYLATGDLIGDAVNESIVLVDYENKPSRADLLVEEGNIIVARMQATNKVLLIDKSTEDLIVSTGFLTLQPQKDFDGSYLAHYFQSDVFQKQKDKYCSGATQKAINNGAFSKLQVPSYLLGEQKRIANILDQADALRQKRKQSLQLLDDLLRATFLDMFGDPVRNGLKTNKRIFGDLFTIKHGFAFKGEYFTNKGEYVVLTPGNFYEEGGYRDRGDKQKYYNGEIPEAYILRKGDMLIAMTEQAPGLLGSPIIVPEEDKFLHNQRLGLLVLKSNEVKKQFLFYLFNSTTVRKLIYMKGTGTKVRHTSPTKIEAIDIYVPPIELQNKFTSIVERIEKTKQLMRTSLAEMDNQFNALTQRHFG